MEEEEEEEDAEILTMFCFSSISLTVLDLFSTNKKQKRKNISHFERKNAK